jgi:hypothetical protein
MNHISIDLETLGTTAGSVVLAIGARRFDPTTGEVFDAFYANLDREAQEDVGLTVNPETEKWWSEQSEEARARLLVDVEHPHYVLRDFAHWCRHDENEVLSNLIDGAWGWGAMFDLSLLEAVFTRFGLLVPWQYNKALCGRSICFIADVKPIRTAGHHQADVDATVQAEAIIAAYKKLGLCNQGDLFP